MTWKTQQNLVRSKCILNQKYILCFYIKTGNLVLNFLLFQEASLQWFFPSFPDFPAFHNIYFTRQER